MANVEGMQECSNGVAVCETTDLQNAGDRRYGFTWRGFASAIVSKGSPSLFSNLELRTSEALTPVDTLIKVVSDTLVFLIPW